MQLGRSVAVLAALTALAACGEVTTPTDAPLSAPGARFINGGTPTGSAYGSVGALLMDFDGNGVLNGDDLDCTGTLVSPTVFLTAGHCIAGLEDGQFYVTFAPDLYAKRVPVIAATAVHVDPQYGHDQGDLHDLAVVILPANATRGV